jgi:hypothetical protein
MRVVISQSMLFPWVGLLAQVRLADVFVHYDDVQFSRGGFVNRVQLKTARGCEWLTVPLAGHRFGQRIDEIRLAPSSTWVPRHLDLLARSFEGAPYAADAMAIACKVYDGGHALLSTLARASQMALSRYFGLDSGRRFLDVGDLGISGRSSERVLDVVRALGGTRYVTGHGAARYLDHARFEHAGISVDYMDYHCQPWPQPFGPFTPYVSGLDLVARLGRAGSDCLTLGTLPWRQFVHEPAR